MTLIFKRLEVDHESATIVIFKTLDLILFILSHKGSQRFFNDVRHKRYSISKWTSFNYNNGEKDYSTSIRQSSSKILEILENPGILNGEDEDGGSSFGSHQGGSSNNGSKYGGMGGSSSGSYGNSQSQRSHGGNGGYGNHSSSSNSGYGSKNSHANNNGSFSQHQRQGGNQWGTTQNRQNHQPPAITHRADEFISHDSDIDVHSTQDPFTESQNQQKPKRTIGQSTQQNASQFKKPSAAAQQSAQPTQIAQFQSNAPQHDPFAEAANSTVLVSNQTVDPFAAAGDEFDAFTAQADQVQQTAAPAVQQPSQPAAAAPAVTQNANDDVFALLGGVDSNAAQQANQPYKQPNSTDSLMSLYSTPAQPQQNAFGNLNSVQNQQQQQQQRMQQQQQQQQPFDMWSQASQPAQPQAQYNPYEIASQQNNNNMFGFQNNQQSASKNNNFGGSSAQNDPFGDIFASSAAQSSAPIQHQSAHAASSQPAQQTTKKADPFDFDF